MAKRIKKWLLQRPTIVVPTPEWTSIDVAKSVQTEWLSHLEHADRPTTSPDTEKVATRA